MRGLPQPVYQAIAEYLRSKGRRSHRDWDVNHAHEDSLTGAAFAAFRTQHTRRIYIENQEWRWRIGAWKFGSGGKASEEKRTGADGIIEVEVRHVATGTVDRKALLIQAKKQWKGKGAHVFDQIGKMEKLVKGSSIILDYSPNGYMAMEGREILKARRNLGLIPNFISIPLGAFLADRFLACHVGIRGLYYDPVRKLLLLPTLQERPDAIESIIAERLRIEIQSMPSRNKKRN